MSRRSSPAKRAATSSRSRHDAMLSRSSLKTKLIEFRDSRKPPREEFGPWLSVIAPDLPRFIGNRNSADTDVLNRWIERCDGVNRDGENLDERLKNLCEVITVPELARLVLVGRHKAATTVNRIYGVKWKTATRSGGVVGLDSKWRDLKDELTDNISLENIEILERALFLHHDYADLVGEFNEEPSQRPAKPQWVTRGAGATLEAGGAPAQQAVLDFVGSYLYLRSGNRFDREVAILTEIAFDLPSGTVNSEQIADARKPRPHKKKTGA